MKCIAHDCGIDAEFLLASMDDGKHKAVLCPNHQILALMGKLNHSTVSILTSEDANIPSCQICGKMGIKYIDEQCSFHLCQLHLVQLLAKDLEPDSFKSLINLYPNAHILHDDFYHPPTGDALQPFNYSKAYQCEYIFNNRYPTFDSE